MYTLMDVRTRPWVCALSAFVSQQLSPEDSIHVRRMYAMLLLEDCCESSDIGRRVLQMQTNKARLVQTVAGKDAVQGLVCPVEANSF